MSSWWLAVVPRMKNYDHCPEVDTDISIRKRVRLKKLLSRRFPVHATNTNENTNRDENTNTFNYEPLGGVLQYNTESHWIKSHLLASTFFLVFKTCRSYHHESSKLFRSYPCERPTQTFWVSALCPRTTLPPAFSKLCDHFFYPPSLYPWACATITLSGMLHGWYALRRGLYWIVYKSTHWMLHKR